MGGRLPKRVNMIADYGKPEGCTLHSWIRVSLNGGKLARMLEAGINEMDR